jgi:hypothetical protein
MEMLIMAAFALAFILPLAFLFLAASSSEMGKASLLQAKASVRTIANEAGEIYLQGPGAKKTILVNYPEGVKDGSVEGGVVSLRLDADSRQSDVVAGTFANITGNLSGKKSAGLHRIDLENIGGTHVNITYG